MGISNFPKFFKKKNIKVVEDSSGSNCYKININLSDSGSNVLVISNYPKRIDTRGCIRYLKKVINFINEKYYDYFENGVKDISIVNLFSLYEVKVDDEGYLDSISLNNDVIKSSIKESDVIIAAWGEPLKIDKKVYRERITDILELIREEFLNSKTKKIFLKVGAPTKFGYPKNCSAWDSSDKLNDFFN